MRVVVTGASGFIGSALARDLLADGHEVVAVTRDPSRRPPGLPESVRLAGWDGRSAEGWGDEVSGAGAVVNLAGENIASGRWTKGKKDRIRRSRLDAGRAVVEAVRTSEPRPAVVIQASAVGLYGNRPDGPLDESCPPGEGFLPETAVDWEASTAPVEEEGVRRAVVRTGIVLGLEGGALTRLLTPFRFFLGGPLGSGRQGFSWIHLADEVGAIRFLIEKEEARGPFNLTAPNPLPQREFLKVLGKAMSRPSWLPVPGLALRLLFGQMAREVLLDGQIVKPARLLEAGFSFRFPDAESALADLLRPVEPDARS